MGILNKIMFWKKDDFDFEDFAKKDMNPDLGAGANPMGKPSSFGSDVKQDSFGMKEPDLGMSRSIDESSYSKPQQTPQMPGFGGQNQQATNNSGASSNKDLELINSKLDTIKAILGSLDQRLANIERSNGSVNKQNNQRQKLW
jgi:hypothetical protein